MLRILDRYIFREIATTWLAVTVVLLMILLTNQFARVLGEVAKGKLPKGAAMDVIGLSAVQYLTVLVPIGLFLSIMLALGRLYRDSEMPAMMACRVGPSGVYRPLIWLTVPLVLGVAWLAIDLGPRALQTVERIGAEARREADLASIEPGRFTVFGPGRAVVYGERVTADGFMENVFLQRFVEDDVVVISLLNYESTFWRSVNKSLAAIALGEEYEPALLTEPLALDLELLESYTAYAHPRPADSAPR